MKKCWNCDAELNVQIQPNTEHLKDMAICHQCFGTNIIRGLKVRSVPTPAGSDDMFSTRNTDRDEEEDSAEITKKHRKQVVKQTTEQEQEMQKTANGRWLLAQWKSPEAKQIALWMVKTAFKKIKTEKSV